MPVRRMIRWVTNSRTRRASELENREFVDQKIDQKTEIVKRWIEARRDLLSRQGTLVESYRNYRGRQLGPYYKLASRSVVSMAC